MVRNREESFHSLPCTQPLKYAEYVTRNVCLLCYKIHKKHVLKLDFFHVFQSEDSDNDSVDSLDVLR